MIQRSEIEAMKQGLATLAQSDIVGLWLIFGDVQHQWPGLRPEAAKTVTLSIVAEMLAERSVVAGQFRNQDENTAILEPWALSVAESVDRISVEWDALDHELNPGDVVWFVDPQILPVTADLNPLPGWTIPKSRP